MKASLFLSSVFAFQAFAFPAALLNGGLSAETLAKITELAANITKEHDKRQLGLGLFTPGFDAKAQKIDISGSHAYKPAGKNDFRGPCTGLNALANHGYISRNGVSNIVEITVASNEVFGMGLDLAGFLATYAAVVSGDLTSVSIGGAPKSSLLGGLLGGGIIGKPQGLANSHNRFEGDSSVLRPDQYPNNDPNSINLDQFRELTSLPLGPNGIDLTVMNEFRGIRHNQSIERNGYYYAGPFMQYAVNAAVHLFTYQFLANRSAEYPAGYLDQNTLATFSGISRKSNGELQWQWGTERIPENWYRRAIGDEYLIESFTKDAVASLIERPYLIVVGGNTGEPNTFTAVDVGDLTGGVLNAQTLLEGNNAMCLAFRAVREAAPDMLTGLVGNVLQAVQKITNVLDPIVQQLGCPQLAKYNTGAFGKFPGNAGGI